jgi:hypothetical protein
MLPTHDVSGLLFLMCVATYTYAQAEAKGKG